MTDDEPEEVTSEDSYAEFLSCRGSSLLNHATISLAQLLSSGVTEMNINMINCKPRGFFYSRHMDVRTRT